jgi:GntR family transcriptional regulator
MEKRAMFTIDPADPTPLYAQLERAIRVAIATGRLRRGDRLPTVRQLAVELRVNANTVAKVYGELERSEVLVTRRGVGTFVRADVAKAVPEPDRERQLATVVDRVLTDAAAFGFTADDLIRLLSIRKAEANARDGARSFHDNFETQHEKP